MKKYIPELDGLRGVGLFFVFSVHYGVQNFGWVFIQSFFVMSGYLISRILLNQKDKPGTFTEKFKIYWIRRALRIFPVYYLYLGILTLSFIAIGYPVDFEKRILHLITYTYNLTVFFAGEMPQSTQATGHLWSLSVEEQLYLLLPLFVFAIAVRNLKVLSVLVILLCIPFRYLLGQQFPPTIENMGSVVYTFSVSHLDAFFVGLAINVFDVVNWKRLKLYLLLATTVILLAGLLNFLNTPLEPSGLWGYLHSIGYPCLRVQNFQHVWSYTLWNVFFGLLIAVLVANADNAGFWLNRFFRWPLFTALGKVSYGMYVFHYCVLDIFLYVFGLSHPFKMSDWKIHLLCFSLFFITVYIGAYLSYHFFEIKFLRLKPRYTGKVANQPALKTP